LACPNIAYALTYSYVRTLEESAPWRLPLVVLATDKTGSRGWTLMEPRIGFHWIRLVVEARTKLLRHG